MNEAFRKFSLRASEAMGSSWAFVLAALIIVVWAVSGPAFKFSDTWQLIINTGTTVCTFLAVFLIQNTQNRDAKAIHLKLDELLRGVEGARTGLVDLEELPDEQLQQLSQEFKRLHDEAPGGVTQQVAQDVVDAASSAVDTNRFEADGHVPAGTK
ncbi:MAG: low affinity iron permease family protein [Tepidiformaceae bacterium]